MIIEKVEIATASRVGGDGLMTEVAMLDILQDTESIGARSDLDFWGFFEENSGAMILVARYARFMRRPKYGETMLCRTMPYANSVRFGSRYAELLDGTGERLACSWLTAIYVNWRTMKPIRVPQNLVDAVPLYMPPVQESWERHINADLSAFIEKETIKVQRFDLDMFKHMNNIRHIEHALTYLPEDAHPKEIRIEYKNSAPLDTALTVKTAEIAGKTYVLFDNPDGNIYSITEFTL